MRREVLYLHAPEMARVQSATTPPTGDGRTLLVARDGLRALFQDMRKSFAPTLRRSLVPVAAVAAVAAVTFAGCSSSHPTTAADTSKGNVSRVAVDTRTVSSSTTARPGTGAATAIAGQQNAQLRSAVRGFWDLYLRVGARTAAFDGPATRRDLSAGTTGAELNRLLAYFSSNAASGYVVHGTVDVAPRVVSIAGTTAQVRDCYDDKTGLYRINDNQRLDTDNPLRHQVLMTFQLMHGMWKVAAIIDEGDGCHV